MRSYQGNTYFRDFARDVQTLAKCFPDVNKCQQVQIIWDGALQYIRLEWMKVSCSPESTSLQELIKRAIHFEAAVLIQCKENSSYTVSRVNTVFNQVMPLRLTPNVRMQRNNSFVQGKSITLSTSGNSFNNNKSMVLVINNRKRLTKTELNELCAQGKCFNCKQVRHDARNCSLQHNAPASRITSSAVNFAKLDKLERARDSVECNSLIVYMVEAVFGKDKKTKKEQSGAIVERMAMKVKDFTRQLPKPVIVEVFINRQVARALLDSGSMADFISTTLAGQLNV